MFWIVEVIIGLIITYLFIKRENPKVKFLFYGYFFYFVALMLQMPFKLLEQHFVGFFSGNLLPFYMINIFVLIIPEVTKYFSLKRFLKTKSYKNGILFGIGWASVESINILKVIFFSYFFSFIFLDFNLDYIMGPEFAFFNFVFFFALNMALTVLIVISIIKKNLWYLFYSILLVLVVFVGLTLLPELYGNVAEVLIFLYSLYIIFHYRKIK